MRNSLGSCSKLHHSSRLGNLVELGFSESGKFGMVGRKRHRAIAADFLNMVWH